MLRAWRANESIMLDANPHAAEAPRTRRVLGRHVSDPSLQMMGLQRGEFDIIRNPDPKQIRQAENGESLRLHAQRRASVMYLSLNQRVAQLAIPK